MHDMDVLYLIFCKPANLDLADFDQGEPPKGNGLRPHLQAGAVVASNVLHQ